MRFDDTKEEGIMMYKYSNNLLPAINDLYVSNNDVHKYSTRQKYVLYIKTLMFIQKTLETQVFVYEILYMPKLI